MASPRQSSASIFDLNRQDLDEEQSPECQRPHCGWSLPLGPALQPNASALVLQAERHVLYKLIPAKTLAKRVEENDVVCRIERQECPQQVGLRPNATFLQPFQGILKRASAASEREARILACRPRTGAGLSWGAFAEDLSDFRSQAIYGERFRQHGHAGR
jgi:hypothetical protein